MLWFRGHYFIAMITKTVQPQVLEEATVSSLASIRELQDQIFDIRGETEVLNRELSSKQEQISAILQKVKILKGSWNHGRIKTSLFCWLHKVALRWQKTLRQRCRN